MLPEPAREFYAAQQTLIVATLAVTRSVWSRMDLADVDTSWQSVAPVLETVVSSAQLGAARNGSAYVGPTLDVLRESVAPEALVRPRGFSGFASDGRMLSTLLEGAKVYAKEAQSLEAAGAWLDMVVHTTVQDAGRQAASVDTFVRPGVVHVRVANPPCCQRCAVLAGKYSAPTAFKRHPRCDCYAVPTTNRARTFGVDIAPEQVKDLTRAQRKAIADGADMNQVINAHRVGARSNDGMTTTEGATRRGIAGKRLGAPSRRGAVRLTPEAIYRVSATREEAIRRLRQNGYII